MKLGVKLGLGFASLLALTAVLGIFSLMQMSLVNDKSTELAVNWMPSIVNIEEMNTATSDHRLQVLQHVLSTDDADMRKYEEQQQEVLEEFLKKRDAYEKLISSPDERALFDKFQTLYKEYMDLNAKVAELSRANRNEEALALLRGRSQQAFDEFSDTLLQLVALNVKGGESASDEGDVLYASARTLILGGIAAAILIGAILAFFITRSILKQLGGEPQYATEITRRVAEGDLMVDVELKGNDNSSLLAALNTMVAKLREIATEVNNASDNVASGSQQMSAASEQLSQGSAEQAASVEETSASIEQMSASIEQNTDNARVTDEMASKAAQEAGEGGQAVQETVDAMKRIAEQIGIIDEIAYQTNLLALNAAIEAARAGEHGKGFAVVAAEVRKLAERSQNAAQEIGQVARGSVGLAERAGQLLEAMVPSIRKTSDLVQEIASASQEQSSGVGQINTAMNQLNQITQQSASASEELAATAEEMSSQAEQLQRLMSFFKLDNTGSRQQRPTQARAVKANAPVAGNAQRNAQSARKPLAGAPVAGTPAKALPPARKEDDEIDESEFVKF